MHRQALAKVSERMGKTRHREEQNTKMTTEDLPFGQEMDHHRQQNEEAEEKHESLVATIREEMRRIEEKHRKIQHDHVRNP